MLRQAHTNYIRPNVKTDQQIVTLLIYTKPIIMYLSNLPILLVQQSVVQSALAITHCQLIVSSY